MRCGVQRTESSRIHAASAPIHSAQKISRITKGAKANMRRETEDRGLVTEAERRGIGDRSQKTVDGEKSEMDQYLQMKDRFICII
jgi:hypothetical protein